MTAFVTAGAGFLLAVLWFDLMFDVQAVEHRRAAVLPDGVLASIAGYYARVTSGARPMNRLVAVAMVATVAALAAQLAAGDVPAAVGWGSLVLALSAVAVAGGRTVPSARRLATRRDAPGVQTRLARAILRDHLLCLALILAVLVLQLGWAR